MANVKKALRVKDSDIVKLNYVGLPLKAIGEILGCHYATVTNRMKAMRIAPVDTRHSFMEGIFKSLSVEQQEWLVNYLYNNQIPIKNFISFLIQQAYAGAIELPVNVPKEVVDEAEALPSVEPEYAHSGDENSPLCSRCGKYPEMDGHGICPNCLDSQESLPKATASLFR